LTAGPGDDRMNLERNNMENKVKRTNRFNGESYLLTAAEAKIHDKIFADEWSATLEDKVAGYDGASKLWKEVRKGLDYFRKNNAKAYMVLLD
jgi:hypothetical protein